MFQSDVTVKNIEKIKDAYVLLECMSPSIARAARPGQFIHIQCPAPTVFFRRPFSIAHVSRTTFFVLVKRVGPGTTYLAERKKGDVLNVLGPLGNAYPLPHKDESIIMVGGGSGIASLRFLMERLSPRKGVVFCGARDTRESVFDTMVARNGWKVVRSTDNGSAGYQGYVSDVFFRDFETCRNRKSVVYLCGPALMMKAIAPFLIARGIRFFVSLETVFACGVGVCQGCAVPTTGVEPYKLACSDGPVFSGTMIDWNAIR